MFDTYDRITLCRCFDAPPSFHPASGGHEPVDDGHQPAHAGRSPAPSLLRPEIHCLQLWIDLNA